ncbi:MAG: DNA-J related domain-containing protein [Candidatus Competibacter sp.]|nr:DNA-J related domain-containing protein [Candidatus Competibacter sp.]MDG4584707.1 DNA-J related domain-containing protein [Candidatus Competibacter sp.]
MNGVAPSPAAVAALEARLLDLLAAHPAGLSEHELLKRLREDDPLFAGFSAREPLSLFRGHYLLFHALYRLRERLTRERRGRLRVDPLGIVLEPEPLSCGEGGTALAAGEPDFARCYANLDRLATATVAEASELLRSFHAARRRDGRRRVALAVLDLRDPVDAAAIKRQYRRLAMRHHPDRGGDGRRFGEINAALAVLEEGLV